MPICPKCKAEIDYLRFSAKVETFGDFNGEEWDTKESGDWHNVIFYCPECDKLLFTDEGKAEAFMNDEDELKTIVNEKLNKIKQDKKKNGYMS